MRALFLGRKPAASEALRLLVDRGVEVVAVVAPLPEEVPAEATFWRPLLRDTARALSIPVVSDRVIYRSISALERGEAPELDVRGIDIAISFLFWKKIGEPLIRLPRLGCFNFHPGPLPDFRGRRGYNFAILEGCAEYGGTVHWVSSEIDAGDIVEVRRFPISKDDTAYSLERKCMRCLLEMFDDFVSDRVKGLPIRRIAQGEGRSATKAEMLAAARILPTDDSEMVARRVRAFWYPPHSGATIDLLGREYTLVDAGTLAKLGRMMHGYPGVVGIGEPMTTSSFQSGIPVESRVLESVGSPLRPNLEPEGAMTAVDRGEVLKVELEGAGGESRLVQSMATPRLAAYVGSQLGSLFPDRRFREEEILGPVSEAMRRIERCFSKVGQKYYRRDGVPCFDHLHTDQYATFLCFLSRCLHLAGDEDAAKRAYALNKALHAVDIPWFLELPEVLYLQHPLGTVVGRARFGDFLVLYQRVTVGGNLALEYPTLGRGVALYGGCSVVGRTTIGDNCWISAGAFVKDAEIPPDSVVFGRSPDLVIKPTKRNVVRDLFKVQ